MIYGAARVSIDGQSIAAQVAALTVAGANKVFREVVSGAQTDRTQQRRLLHGRAVGDVLMVTRLDQLARSTRDLLHTLATITSKGTRFRSFGDTGAAMTTPHGRLLLIILGGLAEFERDLIRTRTGEGRARAQARGVRLGRKPTLTVHQQREAFQRRAHGEAGADIARSHNVHHSTISRLTRPPERPQRGGTCARLCSGARARLMPPVRPCAKRM
jgi:DNA invertase Pin-like site-specific DNA recombinase